MDGHLVSDLTQPNTHLVARRLTNIVKHLLAPDNVVGNPSIFKDIAGNPLVSDNIVGNPWASGNIVMLAE